MRRKMSYIKKWKVTVTITFFCFCFLIWWVWTSQIIPTLRRNCRLLKRAPEGEWTCQVNNHTHFLKDTNCAWPNAQTHGESAVPKASVSGLPSTTVLPVQLQTLTLCKGKQKAVPIRIRPLICLETPFCVNLIKRKS
jgi:hypothetical protein